MGHSGIDPHDPGLFTLDWSLAGRQPQDCPSRFMYKQQRTNWPRSEIHDRSCNWQIMIVSFYKWEVIFPAVAPYLLPLCLIPPCAIRFSTSTESSQTTEVHEDYCCVGTKNTTVWLIYQLTSHVPSCQAMLHFLASLSFKCMHALSGTRLWITLFEFSSLNLILYIQDI